MSEPVSVAAIREAHKNIHVRLDKLEEKQNELEDKMQAMELMIMKQNHDLRDLIVVTIQTEVKPIVDDLNDVKDRPMKLALKVMLWALGVFGTVITSLLVWIVQSLFY